MTEQIQILQRRLEYFSRALKVLGIALREWSLTIGGRAAIFWAPIWGGLKFSEPVFREGYNFLGAFGRYVRTNGFCVTEILSTA